MIKQGKYVILTLITLIVISTSLSARAETLEAQWEFYQIRFRYAPITTFYSCDAIEGKLKRLLIILGARDDARVEMKCFGNDNLKRRREQRIYRILLAFAMPVPADRSDLTREIFPAEWQETRVTGNVSRYLDGGDCELVDQFQRFVIPKLPIKKSTKSLHCLPIRRPSNKLRIRMTVLKAVEQIELEKGRSKVPKNSSSTSQ